MAFEEKSLTEEELRGNLMAVLDEYLKGASLDVETLIYLLKKNHGIMVQQDEIIKELNALMLKDSAANLFQLEARKEDKKTYLVVTRKKAEKKKLIP